MILRAANRSPALNGPGIFPRTRHQGPQLGCRRAGVEVRTFQQSRCCIRLSSSHDAAGPSNTGVSDDLNKLPACRLHDALVSNGRGYSAALHLFQS